MRATNWFKRFSAAAAQPTVELAGFSVWERDSGATLAFRSTGGAQLSVELDYEDIKRLGCYVNQALAAIDARERA